jgi:hypothetical protein
MDVAETTGNDTETWSNDQDFLAAALQSVADRLAALEGQLIHIDSEVHEVTRFIAEHRPALARALSLMDPGAGVRRFMTGKRREVPRIQEGEAGHG